MLQSSIRRGELDRPITFIRATFSRGTSNQDVPTWAVLATNPTVFARKKELKGNEVVIGDKLTYIQKTIFTIVYRDDITTKDRVVFSGRVYEIVSITDATEQRKSYLDVMANLLDNEVWT